MGKDPQPIFNNLYNQSPEFRQLADSVSGMTPEQAFQANGRNFNDDMGNLMQMLGMR